MKLRDEITSVLNRASAENGSDTPDYILADYLVSSLDAFDAAVLARERHFGRSTDKCTHGVNLDAPCEWCAATGSP